ncbi:amidohydrolase family protein [Actinacidiphila acidipaludis]|uniref:Amidohydrolase family protein n=1 Tax=Actinacidiphila acidipaludis TaxID=2873382 RepID=A0ABS7Q8V8_9ACTN|nr:amidohydrolase family protein [Streptomyces acidipaludis]MBY8879567.1 amidohydrolase family protein [Streptomyces acidipaludis]
MTEPVPAPAPFAPPAPGTLAVLRGATLIDGTGAPPRPATTVVVDGERILRVAPDAEVGPGDHPGADVVDLTGHVLLPGLIDSHQHMATPPNRPVAEATLRRDLLGGVTAVRDMADDLRQVGDLARAALVGEIAAPDIRYAALTAGPGFFDDPRTWQVCQGATPGHTPWMQAVTADTDLPLAVARALGTSATAIKVYADLSGERVAAITGEAHRQGAMVWAHAAVFPASPGEVVAAGVDSVSHVNLLVHEAAGRALTTYGDKPPVDHTRFLAGDEPRIEALLRAMVRQGTILDATASMWGRIAGEAAGRGDAEGERRARENGELAAALTAQARRAGVQVSAGTDCDPDPGQPWPPLHEEIAFLVRRCGFSVEQALHSATLVGARSLGVEGETGSVEEGKLANLVVLARDPMEEIGHLDSVVLVVKRGRRYDRPAARTRG